MLSKLISRFAKPKPCAPAATRDNRLRVAVTVYSNRCGNFWPYMSSSGSDRHPAVDLRVEANRQQVWSFPEVKAALFLGDVILYLNDTTAGVFTFGCNRWTCTDPTCQRPHINVCASSTHRTIYSSFEVTRGKLAIPLATLMEETAGNNEGKFLRITIAPYIIRAEGTDIRWMLMVETFQDCPEILQRAAQLLKEIARVESAWT